VLGLVVLFLCALGTLYLSAVQKIATLGISRRVCSCS
jgi:hypothetical protein